ncbi:uncharacterized protein LOC135372128 [Ornithodoros turicata]|uniref:uncharacterized protein LOC135372128 n=1 Tax=Ornithodoros turicata TaxID=34597 RepID=UPI003138E035
MEELNSYSATRLVHNKCIQVTSGDFGFRFSDLVKPHNIRALLGMPTMKLLDTLAAALEKKSTARAMFSSRDRIVITMLVMKHSLSFSFLSRIFGCSPTTCGACVKSTIQALALLLKCAIPWPTQEEIQNNLPICFEQFPSVRVVLDCTEVAVALPKCLKCALNMYSFYKSTQTVKYMIGVSPAGLITYISKGYGGRASDKAIFEQSGLVHSLTPGIDQIMVDKGFLIEDICTNHSIKLVRPPFLRQKQQFSKEEALQTKKIAAARVHVERAIQRIKLFKILSSKLPWHMVPYVDDIVTIAAGLTNASFPILADDKLL